MPLKPAVSEHDHIQGNPSAVIELVEYGDYQCPHCGHAYPIIKKIQEAMGDKLKFVFRNFPLAEIHPQATVAAAAAEAAALQDKYWEMHDMIFENQRDLKLPALTGYAERLGMDTEKFISDIQLEEIIARVEDDFESGIRSGVNGTPTFFVNGEKYTQSWEAETMISFLKNKI